MITVERMPRARFFADARGFDGDDPGREARERALLSSCRVRGERSVELDSGLVNESSFDSGLPFSAKV